MNLHEYEVMHRVEHDHWWNQGLRGAFLRWVAASGPTSVLDAGCGTGINLQLLRQAGYQAEGIDASPEALKFCRSRGMTHVREATIQALPFPEERFDLIYSFDVLGTLPAAGQRGALEEFRRCLKPHGTLLLNVAALPWLYSAHDVATHIKTRFTRNEMRGMLRDAGFDVTFATYRVALLFPMVALFKLLDRRDPRAEHDSVTRGHLELNNALINRLLTWAMALENVLMRLTPLPIGSSLFVVARKIQ